MLAATFFRHVASDDEGVMMGLEHLIHVHLIQ